MNNYIQLKNQQLADHSFIEMQVQGEHENLKIAPLLLTGIIDKIMLEGANYYMLLQFYEKELQFLVEVHSNNGHSGLLLDDAIHIRLKELYPQRHEIFQGRSQFTLTIQLDEA